MDIGIEYRLSVGNVNYSYEKKAIIISIFGIVTVLVVVVLFFVHYCTDVLRPFLDTKGEVKAKMRNSSSDKKRKHYKKKYRYMKIAVIPVFGQIFVLVNKLFKTKICRYFEF